MKLSEAEFDDKTGSPIVKGRIVFTLQADDLSIDVPQHEHLCIMSEENIASSFIVIQPVTNKQKNDNGFYNITIAYPSITLPFDLMDLNRICEIDDEARYFSRGGKDSGKIALALKPKMLRKITNLRVVANYIKKGISVNITCNCTADMDFEKIGTTPANSGVCDVSVEMFISWEQINLYGGLCPAWKFDPKPKPDSAKPIPLIEISDQPRNPFKLEDLWITQGLCWPVLMGNLDVQPANRRNPFIPPQINFVQITSTELSRISAYKGGLSFSDAFQSGLLENGFVSSMGSHYWIIIHAVNRKSLEQTLHLKDSFYLSTSGDEVGYIRYDTHYGIEYGDPFGKISQTIKTLSFNATLSKEGLEMSANAELNDFEPKLIEEHRRKRNSKLLPYTHFTLRATLPWALLKLRNFSFARKAQKFLS